MRAQRADGRMSEGKSRAHVVQTAAFTDHAPQAPASDTRAGVLPTVLASVAGDFACKTALHPVETIKSRLQYMRSSGEGKHEALSTLTGKKRLFRNRWSPIAAIVEDATRTAGILGEKNAVRNLYRGLSASLVGSIPTACVYMPTYELSKALLRNYIDSGAGENDCGTGTTTTILTILPGVITGVVSSCVRVPVSVVKSRVQLGLQETARDAARQAYRAGGVRGLYAGWSGQCTLDVAYAVMQFTALENFRKAASFGRRNNESGEVSMPSTSEDALIGFLTGAVTAVATEPLDVVKLRLMAQKRSGLSADTGYRDFGYTGVVHGLRKAAAEEGLLSLWRGLLPRLLLKSCGSSIWYTTYMWTKGRLDFPI